MTSRCKLWQDELNPRVRCAFGNVLFLPQHESDSTCRGDVGDPGPEGLIGAKGEPGRDGLPGVSNIISCQLPI